jgi:hypothetical protein
LGASTSGILYHNNHSTYGKGSVTTAHFLDGGSNDSGWNTINGVYYATT